MFLTALDITVNVALPDITDSFGTDAVTIQWIIIFYVGSSTGMQLGLGGAADAFGLKRMFLVGLVSYTAAVLAIGLSDDLALVFGLRVFQSVGNALLIALGPAIVTSLFPAEFRGRALGIMAALGTLGMISGSLGGGALVDALGWRTIFLARVPLCLLAIGFSALFLRVPGRRPTGGALRPAGGGCAVCIRRVADTRAVARGTERLDADIRARAGGGIGVRIRGVRGRGAQGEQSYPATFAAQTPHTRAGAGRLAAGVRFDLRELVHPAIFRYRVTWRERKRVGTSADADDGGELGVGAAGRMAVGPRESGLHDNGVGDGFYPGHDGHVETGRGFIGGVGGRWG